MLKKYASCNSEITVFMLDKEEPLGIITKKGNIFVPPNVTKMPEQLPDVPQCVRFVMSTDELKHVQLEGFNSVIEAYTDYVASMTIIEEQQELKQVKLVG